MAQRTGLGKGLEALLGDVNQNKQDQIVEVSINLLDPNRAQARKQFDEEKLQELAASITASGLIQPLLVVRTDDRYKIVAGERRYRAARIAGLKNLPVIVREYDDRQLMEVSLIENLQREDLNPIEEAAGIKLLMDEHDLTQEEVGRRLGTSRSNVANTVRLLTLPASILDMIRAGELSKSHARVLVPLKDEKEQLRLAREMAHSNMPVRAAEDIATKAPRKKAEKTPEPELLDIQEELQSALGTRVIVNGTSQNGKIVIEYYSQEELDRLYELFRRLAG